MTPDRAAQVRFRLVDVDCTSASCNLVLSRHLGKAKGVVEYYVNPMNSMLVVRYDPTRTTAGEVETIVRATGFKVIGPIMARGGTSHGTARSPPAGGP